MKQLKIALIVILTGIILILAAGMIYAINGEMPGFSTERSIRYTENYELANTTEVAVGDISIIKVLYSRGAQDISITSGKKDNIIVREYMNFTPDEKQLASVATLNNILTIQEGEVTSSSFGFFGNRKERGYIEIEIPSQLLAEWTIKTASGDVSVYSLQAKNVDISTKSGDVRLTSVEAETNAVSTVSGDIDVSDIMGKLNFSTTSGDVQTDMVSGQVKVHTISGDVKLRFHKITGDIICSTTSGDVDMVVPKENGFTFRADTVSGDITTFWQEGLTYNKKGTKAEGTYESNSAFAIEIDTISGDVSVR